MWGDRCMCAVFALLMCVIAVVAVNFPDKINLLKQNLYNRLLAEVGNRELLTESRKGTFARGLMLSISYYLIKCCHQIISRSFGDKGIVNLAYT